jgi:hypothetical protein
MIDLNPKRLPCVGGPLSGEAVSRWQRRDDTYEVFQVAHATEARSPKRVKAHTSNARERTRGIWASDLPYTLTPAGTRLGHYRLDFGAGAAIWMSA